MNNDERGLTAPDPALEADVRRIAAISAVPGILDVVCRTTGMGFAAVARVTDSRWIACAVQDQVSFGLEPGSELELKTTICDEIRSSRTPVVFDDAAADPSTGTITPHGSTVCGPTSPSRSSAPTGRCSGPCAR